MPRYIGLNSSVAETDVRLLEAGAACDSSLVPFSSWGSTSLPSPSLELSPVEFCAALVIAPPVPIFSFSTRHAVSASSNAFLRSVELPNDVTVYVLPSEVPDARVCSWGVLDQRHIASGNVLTSASPPMISFVLSGNGGFPFKAPSRRITFIASAFLPCVRSQYGDSGMMKKPTKASTTGMEQKPTNQRHPMWSSIPQASAAVNMVPMLQKYSTDTNMRPRYLEGVSSARMSKGTDNPPIPKPTSARKITNAAKFQLNADANPMMATNRAAATLPFHRPYLSANGPNTLLRAQVSIDKHFYNM
eukprot:m.416210 g.416210  ORF g.416210 m.416210 type:complete len:303 (+) comp21277_c1_seq2:680-1588(+)